MILKRKSNFSKNEGLRGQRTWEKKNKRPDLITGREVLSLLWPKKKSGADKANKTSEFGELQLIQNYSIITTA